MRILALGLVTCLGCALPGYDTVDAPPDAGPDVIPPDGGDGGAGGGGGGGGGGGAPSSCWGMSLNDFQDIGFQDTALAGANPHDATVLPDGLTLYYLATAPGGSNSVLYKATRTDRTNSFSGGTEVTTNWVLSPNDVRFLAFSMNALEVIVAQEGKLRTSVWNNNAWSPLVDLTKNDLGAGASEDTHSITADGARLIFTRNDGPTINVPNPLQLGRLYEVNRNAPTPGGAFDTTTPVSIPGITKLEAFLHGVYCPALSADGRRLFFATNREVVTEATFPTGLKLAFTERADRDAQWSTASFVNDALNSTTSQTCPSAVTEDGCELFYHEFGGPNGYVIHVARRGP